MSSLMLILASLVRTMLFLTLMLVSLVKPGLKLSNELINTIEMKIFMPTLQREGPLCIFGGDVLLGA